MAEGKRILRQEPGKCGITDMKDRYYKRNFLLNVVNEGVWGLSVGLTTPATILAVFVSQFTSSKFFIGLLFTIPILGNFFGPVASYLGSDLKKKKIPLIYMHILFIGCWFIISAFAFMHEKFTPLANLTAFFIIYGLQGFVLAAIMPHWFDYLSKILSRKVGTFLGLGLSLSGTFSILGALWAKNTLERNSGVTGFAWCFLFAGFVQMTFFLFFGFQKEEGSFKVSERKTFRAYMSDFLKILRKDREYTQILIVQILSSFGAMSSSFYAVFAASKIQMTGSVVGTYTLMLIIGGIIGSILLGVLGDMISHKISLSIAISCGIAAAICAFFANSLMVFYVLFFLLGVSLTPTFIACTNLVLEMAAMEHRPAYFALNSMLISPFAAIAPLLGGFLINAVSYAFVFAITIIVLSAALAILLLKPRKQLV